MVRSALVAFTLLAARTAAELDSLDCEPTEGWEQSAGCYDTPAPGCTWQDTTGLLDAETGVWLSETPWPEPETRLELEETFTDPDNSGVTATDWSDLRYTFWDKSTSQASTGTLPEQYLLVWQFVGRCCDRYVAYSPQFCVKACYEDDLSQCTDTETCDK